MVNIRKFDASRYLSTPEDIAIFLDEAIKMDDPNTLIHALSTAAKAQGMSEIARRAGVGRESLYKSLSDNANPGIGTVMKILHAMGVKISLRSDNEEEQSVGDTQSSSKELAYA